MIAAQINLAVKLGRHTPIYAYAYNLILPNTRQYQVEVLYFSF